MDKFCPNHLFKLFLEKNKKMEEAIPDKQQLLELINFKMPFGKYKDRVIIDLPEHYLVWFSQNGFPKGKLGNLMAMAYEIKLNGLEKMIYDLRKMF
jgi:uncharacterized protein